jgi:hypothetical protein
VPLFHAAGERNGGCGPSAKEADTVTATINAAAHIFLKFIINTPLVEFILFLIPKTVYLNDRFSAAVFLLIFLRE